MLLTNRQRSVIIIIIIIIGAGIAQSIQRLATGLTVRDGTPVGARFSAPMQAGPGATQPSAQWEGGLSRG